MPPQEVTDKDGGYLGMDNITDKMIGMELKFDQWERMRQATQKITGRCLDGNGRPIGTPHQNQLNRCLYNVEFKDGTTNIIYDNTIANKIWDQVVENGYSDALLHSIFDCKFDSNTVKGDSYVVDCNEKRRLCKTTAGVKLQVALRSGDKITKTWLPLKDLKESNPVGVTEFAKASGLE